MVFCPEMGGVPPEQSFVVESGWQQVCLAMSASGNRGDEMNIQGVLFAAGPMPGGFSFQIDDVALE